MKEVLVTAFDAFGDAATNPSELVVGQLATTIAGAHVHTAVIPTVFNSSATSVFELVDSIAPDVIIMLGQAAGRSAITPERVAINVDDARIPDNASALPIDKPIVAGGPSAYFSTLPIKAITKAISDAGIPASVSNTAGTFVCNHVFYSVMHHLTQSDYRHTRAGFIHIPAIPQQELGSKVPTVELDIITKAIEIAIETALTTSTDAVIEGGSLH